MRRDKRLLLGERYQLPCSWNLFTSAKPSPEYVSVRKVALMKVAGTQDVYWWVFVSVVL